MTQWRVVARLRDRGLVFVAAMGLAFGAVVAPNGAIAQESVVTKAATGKLQAPVVVTPDGIARDEPSISGGSLAAAIDELQDPQDMRAEGADLATSQDAAALAISQGTLGCHSRNTDGNVRVNQDCGFRRQAEETIKINPVAPQNIIAGQNDSRIGFNHCGFDFSLDNGRHWGDGIPPFFNRLNSPPPGHTIFGGPGSQHTYDAASDPALAFDSVGRAFYACIVFDVADVADAILVASSPENAGGSFYNNVPATGTQNVAVEDNSPRVVHDKEFITADSFASSPFRDNVYLSWTVFEFEPRCVTANNPAGQCSSRIFFSRSIDHASTWTAPMEINGNSPTLCFGGNGLDPAADPHQCNRNQGSDPLVLPNGDVVVTFNSNNTPPTTPNRQLLAVVSHDGGVTFGPPSKVGDDVVFASFPTVANPTAPIIREPRCNFGRGPEECIPGAFIRTNDFPRIAVDKNNSDIFVTWQDYRSAAFNIQLSVSHDHSATWHQATNRVNPDSGRDHYMPAIDIGSSHQVADSYYRSERVPNENTAPQIFAPTMPGVQAEPSNIFISGGRGLATPFADRRVSPDFAPPDGNQAGFNGDYSGLAVHGSEAHPIWSDTRNKAIVTSPSQGVVHDEDIFTERVAIPEREGEDGGGDDGGAG